MCASPLHDKLEIRPELQCRYRGRRCLRLRGWTLSNRRHSLCDHHRMLANQSQQRFHRRRLEKSRPRATIASPIDQQGTSDVPQFELSMFDISNDEALTPIDYRGTYTVTEPTEEDLRILRELLGIKDEHAEHKRLHSKAETS